MPSTKTIRRRAANRKAAGDVVDDDLYEDLDLNVEEDIAPLSRSKKPQQNIEEDIVFDRKTKTNNKRRLAGADNDDDDMDDDEAAYKSQLLAVHPRDAHHDAREGVRGAFLGKKPVGKKGMSKRDAELFDDDDDDDDLDEGVLAAQMSRQDRKRLAEEDYDIGLPEGLSGNVLPEEPEDDDNEDDNNNQEDVINMQVNSVASRFAALSSSERLKMISKQSPEVAKLMEELEKNLADLKDVFGPLRSALFERKKSLQTAGDSMLLEFLETKVQLMLSYCVHILFYLLLKVEGAKVEGHPVLKRLVEIRVYLEKLHPVELRLQHSINRLLSGVSSSAAEQQGARLTKVRNLLENDEAAKSGKYVAKKTAPVIDDLRQRRRAEALADEMKAMEKEEERTMQRKRMTRSETAKFTGALDQVALDSNMQEEEDQYLANASSFLGSNTAAAFDDDDDNNNNNNTNSSSLIERLRARKQQAQKLQQDSAASNLISGNNNKQNQKELKKRLRAARENDEENIVGSKSGDVYDDPDVYNNDDEDEDDDVLDFDELEQEQEEREAQQRAEKRHRAENPYEEPTADRREVDQDITKHRGLTKARPKDRKNPRANQRRKFNVGLRAAKAQNKRVADGAERETGSAPLKTHVVHSTKFQ